MKYNNLKREAVKEIKQRYLLKDIKTNTGLIDLLSRYGKQYKGTTEQQRIKFKRYLTNKMNKEIDSLIYDIEQVEQVKLSFPNPLIITIEWKKSRMWGNNPRAFTNYGFTGSSIGGCGYCKTSTATAQALNSYLPLLALMYKAKNKAINNRKKAYIDQNGHNNTSEQGFNHHLYGYGSGYGVLPHFEGGVGVSSHERIIKRLGLKWQNITSTNNTDVFMITN